MVSLKSWLSQRFEPSGPAKATYHLNVTVKRVDRWFNLVSFTAWRNALPPPSGHAEPGGCVSHSAVSNNSVSNNSASNNSVSGHNRPDRWGQAAASGSNSPAPSAPVPPVPPTPPGASPGTEWADVLTSMEDLVLIRDRKGRCIQILTPQAEHLLYRPPAEMLGKTVYETFPLDIADRFWGLIQQVLQTQQTRRAEFCLPIRGKDTWMEAQISAMSPEAVLWVVRDVSDRKRLETAHQHTAQQLHQQAEQERLVNAITQRIRQSLNLDDTLTTTVAEVRQLLQVDRVLIYQLHADFSGTVVVESVDSAWPSALHQPITDPCFAEQYVQQFQQGLFTAKSDMRAPHVPACYADLLAPLAVRANLVVPILQGDRLWGLLMAHHCASPREWQPWETKLMRQLATQAGIAIQQSELYRQTQLSAQRQRALNQVFQAIRQSLDLDTIFTLATQEIGLLMRMEWVNIVQYQAERQVWVPLAEYHPDPSLPSKLGLEIPDADNLIAQRLHRLEVVQIDDSRTLKDPVNQAIASTYGGAWLLVPIPALNPGASPQVWGSLSLLSHQTAKPWQADEIELAREIANQLAIAIQQANLYRQAQLELAERQRAEAALQQLNQDLEQRVQRRTQALERSKAILRQREQDFRSLVENSPDEILRLDRQFRFIYINPKAATTMGRSAAEVLGKTSLELGFPPDLVQQWETAMAQARQTYQEQSLEYSVPLPTGLRQYQSRVVPELTPDGTVESILVVIRDITTLKQTETALRLSEERLRLALDAAEMGAWTSNLETGEQIWSERTQAIFGFVPGEFNGTREQFLERIHPEDRDRVYQEVTQADQTGRYRVDYRIQLPDQTERWISARGRVLNQGMGTPLCINGVDLDISDRKCQEAERQRAEAALQQSEEMFRAVFAHAPIAISLGSVETYGFIRVNAAHIQLFGYSMAELAHMTYLDITHPDDIAANVSQTQRLREGNISTFQMEKRFIHQSGSLIWANMTVSLIRDAAGNPLYDVAMIEDITARKQAEAALRQSEEQFRRVFEDAPLAIGLLELNQYRVFRSNAAMHEVFGRSASELSTLTLADITHPADLEDDLSHVQELIAGTRSRFQMEKRMFRKNGQMVYVMLTATLLRSALGEPLYCIGMIEDITERKQAERQLRASLQEKEVLLKEIHHRVKNNLQIISSLLRMQSRQVQDSQTGLLLQESQNRVQSMALIHEQLYQSPDLAQIDFAEYVRQLVTNLFRSYGVSRQTIALDIATHGLHLTLNTAIPCGLIVNELVSNSLKYAFPSRGTGDTPTANISIWLQEVDAGLQGGPRRRTLMVRDNGIGIAPDIDWQTGASLGLRIVRNLVTQLQGDIHLNTVRGTCFYITFPAVETG
jgi:PAS domain S-box-containing protein